MFQLFFFTFSSSETWWSELIASLYYEKHLKVLSFDDISTMSWKDKVLLIRENPIATARHFDHRFRNFFNLVIKPTLGYDDKSDDYFLRVEFQARGSPHIHMILWLKDSPKYGISDKKSICDFIDKHVTAEIPGNSFAEIPHFLNCQFHN